MAEFPIQRAPERLGVVPTTAVRARLDVSTGGQELAQAVAGFGQSVFDIGLKFHLMEADTQLDNARMQADKEHTRYMLGLEAIEDTSDESGLYNKAFKETMATREKFMPTNKVAAGTYKSYLTRNTARWGRDTILAKRAKRKDNFRAVGFEKQTIAIQSSEANFEAKFIEYKTHLAKGLRFDIGAYDAEEVAKLKQNTIESHGRFLINQKAQVKEDLQKLIDKTTSDTIREYFNRQLTVEQLDERHERGLIRDSEYKIMKKGFGVVAPEHSNAFAAGRVRRAKTDFDMGAINRAQADKVVLENYTQLDEEAREKVFVDLEDIEENIIAASKSNAYSEGVGLMSVEFVGITSDDDFLKMLLGTTGLTDEERDRINRRWEAEKSNRNLYERAVDSRFKEMRKEGISDVDRFTSESLKIYLQYQKRKRLTLEELEAQVEREQQRIIFRTLKPVSEMTTIEKQKELERIRGLKALTR